MNNHENVAPPGVILHGGDALPSLGEQKRHLRPHPMYHHQSGKALIPKVRHWCLTRNFKDPIKKFGGWRQNCCA